MKTLDRVLVLPELPEPIERLEELAYNLWWSWHPEAAELFETLDPALWLRVNHNPVKLLRFISQERLNEAAADATYLERYRRVMHAFDAYMNATDTWFARTFPDKADKPIAYFSAEFGLHESLPIYSGGLGVLAGDHCKTASDLGIPLVGVGFLYPQGYFQQRISADGTQEAIYEKINFEEVPVQPAKTPDGEDAYVRVELPGRTVTARVWKIQVGRVPLYLLDTDVDPNAPEDRELAARLYGGDNEMRLSQEIILGIG
ncbi:MAG: alpha-glucan family phosphorylase, partial [Ardenticatenia bacterium]